MSFLTACYQRRKQNSSGIGESEDFTRNWETWENFWETQSNRRIRLTCLHPCRHPVPISSGGHTCAILYTQLSAWKYEQITQLL